MKKKNTVEALEAVIAGEKVDERLLESEAVRDALTTFFFEKEARPELVGCIDHSGLMEEYLGLRVEEREFIEELRIKYPSYFLGEIGSRVNLIMGQKSRYSKNKAKFKDISDFLSELNIRKALPKAIDLYFMHSLSSYRGVVGLQSFIMIYDYTSGVRIKSPKAKSGLKSKGNVFYDCWRRSEDNKRGVSFLDWVFSKVPKDLRNKYNRYINESTLTLTTVVKNYLKFKPTLNEQLVSLHAFMSYYDVLSGERVSFFQKGGIKKKLGIPNAHKFNNNWQQYHKENSDSNFDDWVLTQIPQNLGKKYLAYISSILNKNPADKLLSSYLKFSPVYKKKQVNLTSWSLFYDFKNGKRIADKREGKYHYEKTPSGKVIYSSWYNSEERKQGTDFESWILKNASDSLAQRYTYYKNELDEENLAEKVIKSYLQFKPSSPYGYVSLRRYCTHYDIKTGKLVEKADKRKISANSLFYKWGSSRGKDQSINFETWLLSMVPDHLARKYHEFKSEESLEKLAEQTIDSYLRFKPLTSYRPGLENDISKPFWPVAIASYCINYDIETGQKCRKKSEKKKSVSKLHNWWDSNLRNKSIDFETWFLSLVPKEKVEEYITFTASYTNLWAASHGKN